MTINKQLGLELYETMLLLRRFEEQVSLDYRAGRIPGFVHLYIGEEAVATGVCAHLNVDDYVTSTHRGHGHALAKGVSPREVMAELYGRATGCSGGRGGSMHLYGKSVGFLGSSGLVGPSIPTAAGAAYMIKYRGTHQVAVAFFGDGAVNNGAFHEGLNLASAWELPVVFVCENNGYATEHPFRKATKNLDVASRAAAYCMRGYSVDGMDVQAVYAAAGEAIELARQGQGPSLVACNTYRFHGHHEGDPGTNYRKPEEIAEGKGRDPIPRLAGQLLEGKLCEPAELDEIENRVAAVVKDAAEFSAASPWPEPASVGQHLFVNN